MRRLPLGFFKRFAAAGGIGGDGAQKRLELRGGGGIERQIGAAGQPGDLPKRPLGGRITALVKHECLNVQEAELAGHLAKPVDVFLHGVADIDQRGDRLFLRFPAGMGQHLADLGLAAAAVDAHHKVAQALGIADPFRRLAFAEAAKIDKLDVQAAD